MLTLTANRIYWRRVKRLIDETPAYDDPVRRSRELARVGGVARGPMVAMVVFTVLYGVGMIGVVAAIAIPAYQDYTIRAQVTEGLNLADAGQGAGRRILGQNSTGGRNSPTSATRCRRGSMWSPWASTAAVRLSFNMATQAHQEYCQQAHRRCCPALTADGDIIWACGNAPLPEGANAAGGPSGSDVPE